MALDSDPCEALLRSAEERLADSERCVRFEAAQQVEARVDLFTALQADGRETYAAEIIATLEDISPRAAETLLGWSLTLGRDLPVTLHLLKDSRIPLSTARAVAENAHALTGEQLTRLEARLWRRGVDTQPSTTARLAGDAARKTRDEVTAILGTEARKMEALTGRGVRAWDGEPGTDTAVLQATGPTVDVTRMMGRLDAAAQAKHADDPRTKDAVRFDTLVELTTGQVSFALWTETGQQGPMPQADVFTLRVTVPLDVHLAALTGHHDLPATLPRRTTITADTARTIAHAALNAGGRLERLVTDPLTGRLVDATLIPDQHKRPTQQWAASIATRVEPGYEPSTALARFVRLRDGHCLFPGCPMPAARCEIDHRIPYDHTNPAQGGQTTASNLGTLCKRHHLMKHSDGWTLQHLPDGTLRWTTPTGRHITTPPPDLDP